MDVESRLRAANEKFYRALTALDLERMEEVWLHTDWVRCIHPGWELIVGWPAVRASWEGIFAITDAHRVEAGNVEARVVGELGWVSCVESIMASRAVSFAVSTNLFLNVNGAWRMVLHHASSIPVRDQAEPPSRVH